NASARPPQARCACSLGHGLHPGLCRHATRVDGLPQRVVVPLVLVGVELSELGQCAVEDIARAEISRNRDGIAPTGVRLGADRAAGARLLPDPGRDTLSQVRRSLRVPQLADVEVALDAVDPFGADPAEQDVACGLHQALTLDHSLALTRELRFAGVGL